MARTVWAVHGTGADITVRTGVHGDIVHAVLLGEGGGFAIVRSENLFAELTVNNSAYGQDHETKDKSNHGVFSFSFSLQGVSFL